MEHKIDENKESSNTLDMKLDEAVECVTVESIESVDDQLEKRMEMILSQINAMQQHITSIDDRVVDIQKEIAILKDKQQTLCDVNQDEEERSEIEKMKMWIESEVKLPQYFQVLKDNGFEDMESVQYLTENDLKMMRIHKIGHRRKLMRYIMGLNALNECSLEFENVRNHAVRVDVEGSHVVDTAK